MSDDVIAMLRNVGIAVPAPDRIGESNPDAPVSQSALESIRADIDDHLETAARKPVFDGILAECRSDLGRCRFHIDGRTLAQDADVVADGLRTFCTDRSGSLNEQMLLEISKVAYQVAFAPVFGTLFHPLKPETSLATHLPGVDRATADLNYHLSRNENSEPVLRAEYSGRCDTATRLTDRGTETVRLDPKESHIDMAVDYRFDANDYTPSLEGVRVGYALFSAPDLPEGDGDGPGAAGDPPAAGSDRPGAEGGRSGE